jgi:hypothetical protein
MASQLCSLLEKYDLMHHMITFVKNESNNLMSMAIELHSIVDYRPLNFNEFMKVCVLDTLCLKPANMLLMMKR